MPEPRNGNKSIHFRKGNPINLHYPLLQYEISDAHQRQTNTGIKAKDQNKIHCYSVLAGPKIHVCIYLYTRIIIYIYTYK